MIKVGGFGCSFFDVHKEVADYDADVRAALDVMLDLSPALVRVQAEALVQRIEESATRTVESALSQMHDCMPRPTEPVGRNKLGLSGCRG